MTKPNSPPTDYTVNSLSKITGHDRRTIDKVIVNLEPSRVVSGKRHYKLAAVEAAMKAKPGKSLREEKLAEEIRKLRLANDRTDKLLYPKATFIESLRRCLGPMATYGEQKLCNELPTAIVGLGDVNQGRLIAERYWDDVLKYVRALKKEWGL